MKAVTALGLLTNSSQSAFMCEFCFSQYFLHLTSVDSWLSLAQPFSHRLGNHSVEKVIGLLHLIVQHLHALFQLTGLLLLLHSEEEARGQNELHSTISAADLGREALGLTESLQPYFA